MPIVLYVSSFHKKMKALLCNGVEQVGGRNPKRVVTPAPLCAGRPGVLHG